MSASTSIILEKYFPSTHQCTAKFIELVNKFFDCLNSRHLRAVTSKIRIWKFIGHAAIHDLK